MRVLVNPTDVFYLMYFFFPLRNLTENQAGLQGE